MTRRFIVNYRGPTTFTSPHSQPRAQQHTTVRHDRIRPARGTDAWLVLHTPDGAPALSGFSPDHLITSAACASQCAVCASYSKSAPTSVAAKPPRVYASPDALHLWSFLRLQGRRLWLRDRQVRLREWGLRRQGQRRVPLWANLQVRQRLLRVLHGQVLQLGQLPAHRGPCDHPPPTRLLGVASDPERNPPPPLLACRRELS